MKSIGIKKVTIDDIDQLQKIGRRTFYETFSAGNSEENMTKYLDEGFPVEILSAELSDSNGFIGVRFSIRTSNDDITCL